MCLRLVALPRLFLSAAGSVFLVGNARLQLIYHVVDLRVMRHQRQHHLNEETHQIKHHLNGEKYHIQHHLNEIQPPLKEEINDLISALNTLKTLNFFKGPTALGPWAHIFIFKGPTAAVSDPT